MFNHTYLRLYLLYDLLLHDRVLLQQEKHEEQTDGKGVWSSDHHLQHTLPHVIHGQLIVVLQTRAAS